MKEKFYHILSPINLFVMLLLDCGCIYFDCLAVGKIIEDAKLINIAFVLIVAFVSVVAFLSTAQLFKNGVKFYEDRVEFTGLDTDNEFKYCDIERVEARKDDCISLRKNFIDRYSSLIIYLKDEKTVTVTLGLTTKKTLKNITDELNGRM